MIAIGIGSMSLTAAHNSEWELVCTLEWSSGLSVCLSAYIPMWEGHTTKTQLLDVIVIELLYRGCALLSGSLPE